MFRKSYAISSKYTFPVVLSRKAVSGRCSAGIGTFVVVNDEGWIVTAAHILQQFSTMEAEANSVATLKRQRDAVGNDPSLSRKEKQKQLNATGRPSPDTTEKFAAWRAHPRWRVTKAFLNIAVDIAIAKLDNFLPVKSLNIQYSKILPKILLPVQLCAVLAFPSTT